MPKLTRYEQDQENLAAAKARLKESKSKTKTLHLEHLKWDKHVKTAAYRLQDCFDKLKSCKLEKVDDYLTELKKLAEMHVQWIRKPEDWKPKSRNVDKQYHELIDFLFAEYPTTTVWVGAWRCEPLWYLHVAKGHSIRKIAFPYYLTKREAHELNKCTYSSRFGDNLVWVLTKCMGGDDALVKAITTATKGLCLWVNNTAAGIDLHLFWKSVVQLFVNNPMLDRAHYQTVCDYIDHLKFESQQVWEEGERVLKDPPQPDFTMKHRTADALMRQVEEWHAKLNNLKGRKHDKAWTTCGLKGYETTKGNTKKNNLQIWQIQEILTSTELRNEGTKLRHCVGSYGSSCARGHSAIYSMNFESQFSNKKVLTIQVNLQNRTVVQVRGRVNRTPEPHENKMIHDWAHEQKLKINYYGA